MIRPCLLLQQKEINTETRGKIVVSVVPLVILTNGWDSDGVGLSLEGWGLIDQGLVNNIHILFQVEVINKL